MTSTEQEIFDELAGKFEYSGGMTREVAEIKAKLEMERLGLWERKRKQNQKYKKKSRTI